MPLISKVVQEPRVFGLGKWGNLMKLFSTASITMALCSALLVTTPSVSAEPPHKRSHKHAVGLNLLSIGNIRFLHNDEFFYYSDGVYYKKKPHGYVLFKPLAEFRVAALPQGL